MECVFHEGTADGCAEGVRTQCRIELPNGVNGVPILTREIPESSTVNIIGSGASNDGQIRGLRKFRAVPCGVHAEFRDSLNGRKQIFTRSADTYRLDGYAIK